MINVIVAGASGRMGSLIVNMVNEANDLNLAGSADLDKPLAGIIDKADVVIDFTAAEATAKHATVAAERGVPIVIGTTGLSDDQRDAVKNASARTPVLHAPNMSLGVNVLFHLIGVAARTLGKDFRIAIEETHHTKKLDRPSGTAVRMLDLAVDARGADRERDVAVLEETAPTGKHPIEATSYRKGDVVGDHVIRFTGPEEVLEIHHAAQTRELFARGAVVAARWLVDKKPGLYDMSDVLNLK